MVSLVVVIGVGLIVVVVSNVSEVSWMMVCRGWCMMKFFFGWLGDDSKLWCSCLVVIVCFVYGLFIVCGNVGCYVMWYKYLVFWFFLVVLVEYWCVSILCFVGWKSVDMFGCWGSVLVE